MKDKDKTRVYLRGKGKTFDSIHRQLVEIAVNNPDDMILRVNGEKVT
jgi:hypothetical protein